MDGQAGKMSLFQAEGLEAQPISRSAPAKAGALLGSVRESLLELDGVKILEEALTAPVRAVPLPGGRTMRHPGEALQQTHLESQLQCGRRLRRRSLAIAFRDWMLSMDKWRVRVPHPYPGIPIGGRIHHPIFRETWKSLRNPHITDGCRTG